MINYTDNNDIISYLSWAEANGIQPFENDSYEENIYEEEKTEDKVKIKTNNKRGNHG